MRKPWFRKQTQQWYVHDGVGQVPLGPDKDEAFRKWHAMELGAKQRGPGVRLLAIAEQFLAHVENHLSASTTENYTRYLVAICSVVGLLEVEHLRRHHITKILAGPDWTDSKRWMAIAAITRCLNWAVEEGLISTNPLAGLKKPPTRRREHLIPPEDHQTLVENADNFAGGRYRKGALKHVLIALRHSGARPGEVARVTAKDYFPHNQTWVLREHKTKGKTGRPRVVMLTPCLQTLTRILAAARPEGPLFLNSNGKPWQPTSLGARVRKIRRRLNLPEGTVPYSYRHAYTTQALINGVPQAAVAALLGHTSTAMIDRHYGHLDQAGGFLSTAAQAGVAIGSGQPLPDAESDPAPAPAPAAPAQARPKRCKPR